MRALPMYDKLYVPAVHHLSTETLAPSHNRLDVRAFGFPYTRAHTRTYVHMLIYIINNINAQ